MATRPDFIKHVSELPDKIALKIVKIQSVPSISFGSPKEPIIVESSNTFTLPMRRSVAYDFTNFSRSHVGCHDIMPFPISSLSEEQKLGLIPAENLKYPSRVPVQVERNLLL